MRQYFSLIFLLIGLPIVFSVECYFGIDKSITYFFIACVLLIGSDLKRINLISISVPLFFVFLLSCGIIIIFITQNIFNKQLLELGVVFYCIFLALTYKNNPDEYNKLIFIAFYISLVSILLIYMTTPLSSAFWLFHGGRLYIGDTKNPNLVSWVAMTNIITILYIINRLDISNIYKFVLVITIPFSGYLYFMSFSKSSIVGLVFIFFYYFKIMKLKIIFNKWLLVIFFFLGTIIYFHEFDIVKYLNILGHAFYSLIFGGSTNMSASIRHEHFKYFLKHFSNFRLFGHGVNTFRLDSPILQLYIDIGFEFALFFLVLFVFIPSYIILIKKNISVIEEYIIILYLFYLPNMFFHGTPYEWNTWLPTILFYMIFKRRKIVSTSNIIYIPKSSR